MGELTDLIASGLVRRGEPLGPLTTYKAGGPASYYAEIDSEAALRQLISSGLPMHHPTLVLGRGSNLVVADQGFDGLVIRLGGEFMEAAVDDDVVTAGGGVPLPRLARQTVEAGLLGLEFFVGVPGSVGGAVRQNAGCFGVEVKDRLVGAVVTDLHSGVTRTVDAISLGLGYRHSNIASQDIVVSASFKGHKGDPEVGRRLMREITRWRRDHQPGGTLNAGSVFKNPEGISAGELIDKLGLKGTRVGDVAVSDKHANFFVAGPNATSAEIRRLVEVVKDAVMEKTGTILEPEIQFVGFEE